MHWLVKDARPGDYFLFTIVVIHFVLDINFADFANMPRILPNFSAAQASRWLLAVHDCAALGSRPTYDKTYHLDIAPIVTFHTL